MNGFDIALVAVVALSALFAFVRGIIREVIALATWIVGFIAAIAYAGSLAGMFGVARHFAGGEAGRSRSRLILLVVMIVGALVARSARRASSGRSAWVSSTACWARSSVLRAGSSSSSVFALIAGVTALPKQDWWQNSALGASLWRRPRWR